jgi:hypothetical protein
MAQVQPALAGTERTRTPMHRATQVTADAMAGLP